MKRTAYEHELTWQRKASCKDLTTEEAEDLFFPHGADEIRWQNLKVTPYVERMCMMCPVYNECLEFAIKFEMNGIWAATTDYTRKQMRRGNVSVICPGCGSDMITPGVYGRTVCCSCGLSWL